jgi:cytochrome c-type biogenesis protein CcsB
MDLFFFAMALALYLIATGSFVAHLMLTSSRRVAATVLAVAFGAHALAITLRGIASGDIPFQSFHDQLSMLAWLTVGLYLVLQLRFQIAIVGALVSPLAFLLTLSAYLVYSGVPPLPHDLQHAGLPFHVAPAFLGYAVFALAGCISFVYLLQEHQLKGKRRSGMFRRLPSLETLDALNHRFVSWGFTLFTVGNLTGSLLAKVTWGQFWSWEPVEILSWVAWLLYAALLHSRSVGWRGRRAATLTIVGFALLLASFVGMNLVFPGRHGSTFG